MSSRSVKTGQVLVKSLMAALALGTLGMGATAEAACTPAGTIQDNTGYSPDVDFTYTGAWTHSSSFPNALYGTLSWTKDVPNHWYGMDKAVSFSLECRTAFDYFYSAAYNRGHATIVAVNNVTGEWRQLGSVDQYSPTIEYGKSVRISVPWTQRTTIYISANGTKHPASIDTYIDIDAIVPR
ncbi:hypothetical protein [Hyalangium rubrum]|uniref:Lipoprotein n=1 Tax=Hyalangium rubrum TaxID=3103134 RepID=A0ABU5H0R6_9BACT|nr:hypothetical protein [Hyalangium sp. s54d21]MDY7227045.1 hypothetical protein [Hyalangium sp. s54d21]